MKRQNSIEIIEEGERITLISNILEFIIGILVLLCIFLPTFLLLFIFPNNIYVAIIANSLPLIIIIFIVYYYIVIKGYSSDNC